MPEVLQRGAEQGSPLPFPDNMSPTNRVVYALAQKAGEEATGGRPYGGFTLREVFEQAERSGFDPSNPATLEALRYIGDLELVRRGARPIDNLQSRLIEYESGGIATEVFLSHNYSIYASRRGLKERERTVSLNQATPDDLYTNNRLNINYDGSNLTVSFGLGESGKVFRLSVERSGIRGRQIKSISPREN